MGLWNKLFGNTNSAEQSKRLFLKGVQLLGEEEVDEALRCFDRAIELEPRSASAWHWKGVTLDELGKPADALTCFEMALAITPDHASLHFDKGKAQAKLDRREEAIASFREFLRLADASQHGKLLGEARDRIDELTAN